MKLQDIFDTISLVPVSEPKEEERTVRAQQNRKVFRGFDYKLPAPVLEEKTDTCGEFLDYLDQYKSLPKLDREHFADRFTKRVMNYSLLTSSYLYNRMTP